MTQYRIEFIGCKGVISNVNEFISMVADFSQETKVGIQLLDANFVFGKDHIISSFEHAKRAILRDEASTNSFEMELLLYAAGERQIKHAISKMGVKNGDAKFAAIFIINDKKVGNIDNIIDNFLQFFNFKRDDEVLDPDKSKLIDFGIKKQSIDSVKKDQLFHLVLEKIALVDVIK